MKYWILLNIFLISNIAFAEFYLNEDSEYCQSISLDSETNCNQHNLYDHIPDSVPEIEGSLEIKPENNIKSVANSIRLKFLEQIGPSLRRRLMLTNTLGYEPRAFLETFQNSFSKCSNYSEEVASIVSFASANLLIVDDPKEKEELKSSLLKRYKIGLLEIFRLKLLQKQKIKEGKSSKKIESAIEQIYLSYPTLKTMLVKYPGLEEFTVHRLTSQVKVYDYYETKEITHQDVNKFLGLESSTIDVSAGKDVKRVNFFRLAYHKIVNDNEIVNDSWFTDKLVESDLDSTKKSIEFLGDICEMSECEIIESSPTEYKKLTDQTFFYSKLELDQYICQNCQLGREQETFTKGQVIMMSLGTLGAGVGCILSAPICIPAAIGSAGVAYMSYNNLQDAKVNELNTRKVASRRSIIADEINDFEVSLQELENKQKETTRARLALLMDSTLIAGEAVQGIKLSANITKSFLQTNRTAQAINRTKVLYSGGALDDLPPDVVDIFVRSSRDKKFVLSAEEEALLKSHNLVDLFKSWKNSNRVIQEVNNNMMLLYRSKIKQGDEKFIIRFLKGTGKVLFPMYKSFQGNRQVKSILDKILLNPNYALSSSEKAYLRSKNYLDDVNRFQEDVRLGLQKQFATISKVRDAAGKIVWTVTLGAAGANLFVDDYITLDESFDENSKNGMSRYDGKVELVYTSPMPHVSIRIGGLFYNYGVLNVQRYNIDNYKESVGFGEALSGNHIRIELNLTEDEKKKLIAYLEQDVGKVYPLAIPFVDCISQSLKAIKNATGIDVPFVADRSQALSIAYFNLLKVSGNEKVGKVRFATNENPIKARAKETGVNILDSLMFTRYTGQMLLTTPILDQYRLTIDPETGVIE